MNSTVVSRPFSGRDSPCLSPWTKKTFLQQRNTYKISFHRCPYHEMKFIRHQLSFAGKTSSLDTLSSQTQSITHSMNGRVLDCLQWAMSLREPTFVIPVNDFIIYESLPGISNYATRARDNCCCWKKCSLSVEQWEENVHQLFQPRTLRCNPNEAWINCRACVSCLEGDGGIAGRICSSGSCINDRW